MLAGFFVEFESCHQTACILSEKLTAIRRRRRQSRRLRLGGKRRFRVGQTAATGADFPVGEKRHSDCRDDTDYDHVVRLQRFRQSGGLHGVKGLATFVVLPTLTCSVT